MNRSLRMLPVTTALAVLASATAHGQGAGLPQVCFTDSIPLQNTNWNNAFVLPKFDTALGDLVQIDFTLAGEIRGSARVESLDNAPSQVQLQFSATLTLTRPDLSVIVVTIPIANFLDNLAAFDGTIDFDGPSGESHDNIVANDSDSVSSPPPASDLVLFSGPPGMPGTINLPCSAIATSTAIGGGNVITQFMTMAEATCTVCYTYRPNTPPTFTECSANPIMGSVGVPMSFQVCAADLVDMDDVVTLTSGPLPAGAMMTPPLPAMGNPVCSTFDWTPLNNQVGTTTVVFIATDNHGRATTCAIDLVIAECHLLLGGGFGPEKYDIFGHTYSTDVQGLRSSYPVTMDDIPNFPVPQQGLVGPGHVVRTPRPVYAQLVMYNPHIFPANPTQWSQVVHVAFQPNGLLTQQTIGTSNGITLWTETYVDAQGRWRMEFPFTIAGM